MLFSIPFLTLRKHIELDVYTHHAAVKESNPIKVRSKSNYMKRPVDAIPNSASMSSCYGYVELLKRSAILHSWMDWDMIVFEDGIVSTMSAIPTSINLFNHTHLASEFAKSKNVTIVKCDPSIKVECKEDISFVLSAPPFPLQKIGMPSGILDFKHQHDINFFMYIEGSTAGKWEFKLGDQLVALTAMSDRPLNVRTHYDKAHYNYLCERSVPLTKNCAYIKRKRQSKGTSND